ncbi:MAG: NAD(P)H-hydrate dehydratase [Chitinophagaceae bacterium]
MQILVAEQVRAWDEYTIQQEPVSSVDLMERAATAFYDWLLLHGYRERSFSIFCGKGNNGGDGLVIARLLAASGHTVTVYILEFGHKGTTDFQVNLARLHDTDVTIRFISNTDNLYPLSPNEVVIDALLGTGLNRPTEGLTADVIQHINQSGCEVLSVDIPSGMFTDNSSQNNTVINATHTISFQCYKLAFLLPENAGYTGRLHILPIGLHPGFIDTLKTPYELAEPVLIKSILRPRQQFAHKGTYGHAALIAGSKGMVGAAILAAQACLRSGVGKLTCHIPAVGYTAMQVAVPEAMCSTDAANTDYLETLPDVSGYNAIGVGPGVGQYETIASLLEQVFVQGRQLVIDADALNVLAAHQYLLSKLPANTILTPHIREFERLFGKATDDFARLKLAQEKAAALNIIIVLKGHYSAIITPGGKIWFNSTGNPGMATGGSGDVLTGIITGLLAQGYVAEQAAIAGVFLHGLAGDLAATTLSQQAMIASDITAYLGNAFLRLSTR